MKNKFIYVFLLLSISCFPQVITKQKSNFKIFGGTSGYELAKDIAIMLEKPLNEANIKNYRDGEIGIYIDENIRNNDVYIIQSTCPTADYSINDNLVELYLFIRTCKRAAAKSITVVMPYFGYTRQDRKINNRVPISASDIALLLETAGADHIISVDLYLEQIQGFFHNIPVDNLSASNTFASYFARKNLNDLIVVAPHREALSIVQRFILSLGKFDMDAGQGFISIDNHSQHYLVGDVKDKNVIIVDDMCDTANTLIRTANLLKEKGANKIYACITHPVFSSQALEKIKNSCLEEVVVADTIPIRDEFPHNVTQISISPLIAEAIKRSHRGESLTNIYRN